MPEWLTAMTRTAILIIDAMAVLMIAIGTVEAFVLTLRVMLVPSATPEEAQSVWLRFSRWLITALTFQLAADVMETSVTPSWEGIGRLAAIAAIRTFINFFLERDLREIRRSERESNKRAQGQEIAISE
jgi:uncharacterized membrane protein